MKLLNKEEMERQAKKLKLFPQNSKVEITDVLSEIDATEGLVNQIFKIEDAAEGVSYVAKQVLPFALAISKSLGETHPMDPDRIILEARALTFINQFWEGSAPEIYKIDRDNGLIIMQDLTDYKNLRFELPKGIIYPGFGIQIGAFLAGIRYYTSDLYLSPEEQKVFISYFENEKHRTNLSNMIMGPDCPLYRDENFEPVAWPSRAQAASNALITKEVDRMCKHVINSFECFCHMDLHIGNILVSGDDLKIIDSEFSGMGASFMDLGRVASSFLINYFAWLAQDEDPKNIRGSMLKYDLQMIYDLFESYRLTLKGLLPEKYQEVYDPVLKDSIRLCLLSTILRMQSGLALSHDIALIPDNNRLGLVQKLAFDILQEVFDQVDDYNSIDDFIEFFEKRAVLTETV